MIKTLEVQMEERPGNEYDPSELLLRLNAYVDCGETPIYRRAYGETWYDIDNKRSCGGGCKTQIHVVFNEKDCPANADKILPALNFQFKMSDLESRK